MDTVVVLGGGFLAARDPILLDEIDERLAEVAPKARTVVTEVSPVVGAALLGLDQAGAGPEAKQRLRGNGQGAAVWAHSSRAALSWPWPACSRWSSSTRSSGRSC